MNTHKHTLIALVVTLLAACGGGGGGTASSTSNTGMPTGPGSVASTSVQGTAATGLAWAQADVLARCRTGEWSTRTDANGDYRFSVPADALPCLLRASAPGTSQVLYSAALLPSAGGGVVANITPLSELVLARILGRTPQSAFADSAPVLSSGQLSAARADSAQREVAQALARVITLDAQRSVLSTPFVAAIASEPTRGDAHDRQLDALHAALPAAQWQQLRTLAADTGAMPVLAVAEATAPGAAPRSYVLMQPRNLYGLPDTNPLALRSEPALALWSLVAGFDALRPLQFNTLAASDLPDDVWPVHFQSWEWTNGIGGHSGFRNDGACSVRKVENSLVATVGLRSWAVRMDGLPALQLYSGLPTRGDALGLGVALRTVVTRAITRHVELRAQDSLPLVHPVYGPFDGGTSIALQVSYDPLDSNAGASATLLVTETVANTDPATQAVYPYLSHQYRCIDQNYTSAGNTETTPADSTLR